MAHKRHHPAKKAVGKKKAKKGGKLKLVGGSKVMAHHKHGGRHRG